MFIKQYISIIFKRCWIIIVIPLIAVVAAVIVSCFILKPVYESSTSLYVINKNCDSENRVDYYGIMAGQLLVKDYREIIKSRTVINTVISELGLYDVEPKELAENITVKLKNDTSIIEIIVKASSPEDAKARADMVCTIFINRIIEVMEVDNISIVDDAEEPLSPAGISSLTYIIISLILGMLAAISTSFLLEYLDETIRTVEDVERNLGLTVMATIPSFNIK